MQSAATEVRIDSGLALHMSRVYANLGLGVVVSAAVAWAFAATPLSGLIYLHGAHGASYSVLGWVCLFAPLVMLLLGIVSGIGTWGHTALRTFYLLFTAFFGVSLSSVLLTYAHIDVIRSFLVTAVAFGGLSIYGYTTWRDLSGLGAACHMMLWGLIAAGVVTALTGGHRFDMVTSAVSLLVFSGLIAYDTQDAKVRYLDDPEDSARIAVWSAMELYLDVLNMFLDLMRLTADNIPFIGGGSADGASDASSVGDSSSSIWSSIGDAASSVGDVATSIVDSVTSDD